LVLLETDRRGPLGLKQGLSEPKERLLESCAAPIWILPTRFVLRRSPVHGIVVPMSGECGGSEALERAIEMGNRHGVPVDIVHITSAPGTRRTGERAGRSALGYASDEFHHEYPALIEELIVQASPFASPRDRLIIRGFNHCYGELARELKRHIRSSGEKLLIFEWKGTLKRGHADRIKLLLRHARGPLLLVRERRQVRSRLRSVERRQGTG
jgi:hypothetical protein